MDLLEGTEALVVVYALLFPGHHVGIWASFCAPVLLFLLSLSRKVVSFCSSRLLIILYCRSK